MLRTRVKGFTLLELMVTIAVFAILATIAVPAYRSLGRHSAITATANSLVAALHFARTHAVEHDCSMIVAPKNQQWKHGWIVQRYNNCKLATGDPIQVHQRQSTTHAQINWNGNSQGVVFDSNGFSRHNNCKKRDKSNNQFCSFSITGKNYPYKTCVIVANTGRIQTLSGDKGTSCSTMSEPGNLPKHQHPLS